MGGRGNKCIRDQEGGVVVHLDHALSAALAEGVLPDHARSAAGVQRPRQHLARRRRTSIYQHHLYTHAGRSDTLAVGQLNTQISMPSQSWSNTDISTL